jgi:hypothetical protein
MSKKKGNLVFLILLAAFPLVLMGGGLFFCCRNSGFSIDKITSRLDFNYGREVEPLSKKQREFLTQNIFSQKFYYFSSGHQYYGFISEDREYILKFFKMKNLFPKDWLDIFPFSILQRLGFKSTTSNKLFSERIFENYKAAYESLREETGLVYIHLNKTREFTSNVTLIDSKGKKYFLNLDNVEFVLQHRAQKIYEYLNELVKEKNYEDLKKCIRSFLLLIATRCEKGFVDRDLSIRNNFGCVGNKAIQLDCATLTKDSSMKYPLNFRNEVLQAAEQLGVWARENYAEATLIIQEEAQKIINHSF